MKRFQELQVAVLGAGPIGMIAALELSRSYQTALVTRTLPSPDEQPRVEAVPASLLTLLMEYGIHPPQIGAQCLHEFSLIAWEEEVFVKRPGPLCAHIERPALDLALLKLLAGSTRVDILVRHQAEYVRAVIEAARRHELRVIDATGRAAVSANKRICASKPWAARTFLASTDRCTAGSELRIAALPGGFVYRLGAAKHLVLGIVGRSETIGKNHQDLEQLLQESGGEFILEGLPSVADMTPGRISVASAQWTSGDMATRIGDAALARDTLSSQGLATGISEALYAGAIRDEEDESLLSLRQDEQRAAHLRSLASLIAKCRFRECNAWRDYGHFIREHIHHDEPSSKVALRDGKVCYV
jgi:flavin-dependent dehydrogenase